MASILGPVTSPCTEGLDDEEIPSPHPLSPQGRGEGLSEHNR